MICVERQSAFCSPLAFVIASGGPGGGADVAKEFWLVIGEFHRAPHEFQRGRRLSRLVLRQPGVMQSSGVLGLLLQYAGIALDRGLNVPLFVQRERFANDSVDVERRVAGGSRSSEHAVAGFVALAAAARTGVIARGGRRETWCGRCRSRLRGRGERFDALAQIKCSGVLRQRSQASRHERSRGCDSLQVNQVFR